MSTVELNLTTQFYIKLYEESYTNEQGLGTDVLELMKRTPICQEWQVSVDPDMYSLIMTWLIAHQAPHPGKRVTGCS